MEGLSALLHQYNISPENIATPQRLAIIATVCVICIIAYFIMKKIIIPVLKRMVSATSAKWDDHLLNDKVLRVVCYLVPMILLYIFLPIAFTDKPVALILIDKLCKVAIIAVCIKLVNAFISSFYHISNDYDLMRNRPLKVFYQMLKVIVIAVGLILIISIIIDKRLDILLTGLGASAAVLMLVFKDTIMGLVAGVQINAYDTLRPGDWIIMEKYGANGEVMEVTLNLVKVLNWDNSIVTIPSFLFISESFRNMRKMRESKARRMNEKILIDINTIHFCDSEEEKRLQKLVPKEFSKAIGGGRLTNLHYFRYFVETYLRNHPEVTPLPHLMVRQQPSENHGLPIEIYCFTTRTAWVDFEHFKAEVMEYAYASLAQFGLRAYQSPAGTDLSRLTN